MTARKPTLCVVAGPNGSGKTTTTVQLLNNEWAADSLYINPDNIAQETFGDWNSPEAVLKAAEEATRQRYECLEQGQDFIFETVFSSIEKLEFGVFFEGAKHTTTVFVTFFFDEFDCFIKRDGKRIDTLRDRDVLVVVAYVWTKLADTYTDGLLLEFT